MHARARIVLHGCMQHTCAWACECASGFPLDRMGVCNTHVHGQVNARQGSHWIASVYATHMLRIVLHGCMQHALIASLYHLLYHKCTEITAHGSTDLGSVNLVNLCFMRWATSDEPYLCERLFTHTSAKYLHDPRIAGAQVHLASAWGGGLVRKYSQR